MRKRNVILAVLFALLTAGVANAALPKKVSGWYGYNAVATSTATTSVWYAAPESDPVDVTDKIVNPNFNNGKDGWEGNFGNGAVKATSVNPLITSFGGGFDVHQTITGLTPGCYTLKVQAFAREKSNADIVNAVAAGTETYDVQAYLYAGNAEVKVLHIAYNGTDGMPDSSGDAANVFNAGSYDQSLDFVVGSNGTTTIGIKNLSSNSVSYVGYDNFRLYYTGEFEGGIEDIADLGDLPLLTTDESNPILYRINNTRRTAQGKANWWDSFNGITTNKDDAALVYFTGKYVGDNLKVKIHLNESTYTLAGDFTWAVEGIDWYIKEFTSAQGGPYKGVIISNSPNFPNAYGDVTNADGTGCWYVGSSNASPWMYGGQWDGSIFTCEINDPSQIDYVAALISKVPEGKMNADVQAELDNAIAALQADATVKNYEALQALIADAKASIAAYDLVKSTLNGADALNETAKAIFNEKAADIIAAYNNGTLTTDVADTVAAIKAAIAEAAKAGIQEGDNISSLIINGTFDVKGDETGWKVERYDGNNPADFKNGVVTGRGFYRLTQTIEGLPAGTYTLSAQAFTRPMDNGPLAEAIAAGQDIVNEAYIFANGDSVKVHLITDVPEGHAVPNGSGEVATAFADGCYPVSVTVEVGEDGVLTFGFVNWNNVWDNYAGVDNFTLTFDKAAEPTPQPNVEKNVLNDESYNFEGGTTGGWKMQGYNNNEGNATATAVKPGYEGSAYCMQLSNPTATANAYEAQLPISLPSSYIGEYTLTFFAKASEEGAEIQFGAQHSPWSADNKEWQPATTVLTTEWQQYTIDCILGDEYIAQGGVNTLYINFGHVVGTVELDRIAFVPVNDVPEIKYVWRSLVDNGNLVTADTHNYIVKENGGANPGALLPGTITEGIGPEGGNAIKLTSYAGASQDWDAQFFIALNDSLPAGTQFKVSFDYMGSAAVSVGTQSHGAPGDYKHWACIGNADFTTEWKHFEYEGTVDGGANNMQSIAFNLSVNREEDIDFFFSNFKAEAYLMITPQPNVEGNILNEDSYNFEKGLTGGWQMQGYNNNGGNATAKAVEPGYEGSAYSLQLSNPSAADAVYGAQLPISLGGEYTGNFELSFYAKASEEGAEIQFGAQHSPWSADNKEWFAPTTTLTTDWQKYTIDVEIGDDYADQGGINTLYINFGHMVGTVDLDRIALVPVEKPEPGPEPNPYDYTFESYVGNSYEEYQANVDMAGILADLGAESLNEVNIFAVLGDGTLDPNYQVGNTDGWRNADGMWQSWGADARYCVKADFTLPENQIYYVGGMYEQTKEPATYTATFAFVKKPYVPAPAFEEIAQDQGTQYDDFTRATVEYGDGYTEYTVTGDLHVAIKNKGEDGNGIDVTNCEKVVIEFAEPVPAGWKVSYSGVQSPDAWLDVPEGATSYTIQIAGTEYAETGILPEFTLMVGWSGATPEKPLSCKVVGIYKYFIPVGGGEEGNTDGITPTLPEIPVVTNDGEVEEEVCDTVYVNVTLKYVERPDVTLNIVGEEDANFTVETFANGYNLPFEGSIDLAAGLEAIGCDAETAEVYAYYTDEEGNPVFVAGANKQSSYDGWFYLDGTPKSWGEINSSEDNRGIYVKFDPTREDAVYEIGTFPSTTCGYDSTSYTVKWVIANPETGKGYCYNITVTGEAEAVAINGLKNGKQIDWKNAYDLTGRKVASPVKGNIYIVNGKKVLFK